MTMFQFDDGELTGISRMSNGTQCREALSPASSDNERQPRPALRTAGNGDGLKVLAATPPMRITSQSPARLNTLTQANMAAEEPKLNLDQVKKRAAKKKKRKGQMKPAAPAVQTIRGFQTPVTSGDEFDSLSAASTPRLLPKAMDVASITSSPAMRPLTPGGISALKLQLDTLSIGERTPRGSPTGARSLSMRRTGSTEGSEADRSERSEMDTYEVPLQHDFVSPEITSKPITGAIEGGLRHDTMARKMTAEDFEPLTCLGKGAFGTVLLVKQKATGRLYAQKQFKKASLVVHKRLVEQTKTERHILESVNQHPFVVKLFYAFQDHEKLYLILEYGQGGELFHHLAMERMFSEETAAFYMAEMVLALDHLHRDLGVIYRDLKPENCLLDADGHLLLTDFGLSKVAVDEEERTNSILGTVDYMAPEVVQGHDYGMAVDWWSLGALGYDMLTGSPPFTGNNNAKIQEKIVKSKLNLPFFLGPDAKDLMVRLLRKDPKKRLGANMPKDLQTIKNHRFFRKIDWKKLAKRELEPPIMPLVTDPELAENFSPEFTDLAISPVLGRKMSFAESMTDEKNPFGGFSFVASESLLDSEMVLY
jgi:serine/threonine-protein kinase Psk1